MRELDLREDAAARLAHALAHPVRLRILALLRDEGAYVMHLTSMLGRPQANVSQHLAILRDAGLVTDEREGMTVVYRVRDARVFDLVDRLEALAPRAWSAAEEGPGGSQGWGAESPMRRVGPRMMRGPGPGGNCHCPRCSGR